MFCQAWEILTSIGHSPRTILGPWGFPLLPLALFHLHYCIEIQFLVALISVFQHYLYSTFFLWLPKDFGREGALKSAYHLEFEVWVQCLYKFTSTTCTSVFFSFLSIPFKAPMPFKEFCLYISLLITIPELSEKIDSHLCQLFSWHVELHSWLLLQTLTEDLCDRHLAELSESAITKHSVPLLINHKKACITDNICSLKNIMDI